LSGQPATSEDLARAVFSAGDSAGRPIPREQTRALVNEVARLCGDRRIVGFIDATVGGATGYVFAVIADGGYLLQWEAEALETTFLGSLPGLQYVERTRGIGGTEGFEGERWLRIEVAHARLPGPLAIEVPDWQMADIGELRATLRSWVGRDSPGSPPNL
jgi:hypothetical protein